ncbi:15197_t:CDS:2, partial [Entrophospora sp. SA101]
MKTPIDAAIIKTRPIETTIARTAVGPSVEFDVSPHPLPRGSVIKYPLVTNSSIQQSMQYD